MAKQLSLFKLDYSHIIETISQNDPGGRGAIFTRKEVVEFILDLSGYTVDQELSQFRLLEPSFGEGNFLLIDRSNIVRTNNGAIGVAVEERTRESSLCQMGFELIG